MQPLNIEVKSIKLCQVFRLCCFFSLYLLSSILFNVAISSELYQPNQADQQQLHLHFEKVIQQIDQRLLDDQLVLKTNPTALDAFINQQILSQWDGKRTLKYLVGKKLWQQLTKQDIAALEESFHQTFLRYVREGMGWYDGQRVKTLRVQLNKLHTRGLLTLRVEPVYLPAFNIQFKIAPVSLDITSSQNESSRPDIEKLKGKKTDSHNTSQPWLLYDILVKGISYIKLKKSDYRHIIKNQGFEALLKMMDDKNKVAKEKSSAKKFHLQSEQE